MKTRNKTTYISSPITWTLMALMALSCPVQGGNARGRAVDGTDSAKSSPAKEARDPFWPVGYTPEWIKNAGKSQLALEMETTGDADWNAAMKEVSIQGVSSRAGNEFYAVINGQIKSVGDAVSVKHGNSTYSWAIESITPPSSVKLRRISVK